MAIPVGGVDARLLDRLLELLLVAELVVVGTQLFARRLRALHELLGEAQLVAGRSEPSCSVSGARTMLARVADGGTGRSESALPVPAHASAASAMGGDIPDARPGAGRAPGGAPPLSAPRSTHTTLRSRRTSFCAASRAARLQRSHYLPRAAAMSSGGSPIAAKKSSGETSLPLDLISPAQRL